MATRVMIAEQDPVERNELKDFLTNELGCQVVALARDGQEAIQMAMQFTPNLAFISYEMAGMSGPDTCEVLNAIAPDIMCVLISGSKSSEQPEMAMRAGARALLVKPIEPKQLEDMVSDLSSVRDRRDSPQYSDYKDPTRYPRLISVTGAKGGVGKTTIAVNLAVALAKKFPNKVALIDMYTEFGDVSTMLSLQPKTSIVDLAPVADELDVDMLQNYLIKHPSGVSLLVAAVDPAPMDTITPRVMDNLLYVLKRMYRFIIVDAPPVVHEATMHIISNSNTVLLIANLFDITAATQNKRFYDILLNEHVSKENIKVVLNRVSKVNKLHPADVEQMFDCGIVAHIPNDSRMVTAVNTGIPPVMTDGDSPFSKGILRLASSVAGTQELATESSGGSLSFRERLFGSGK